MDASFARFLDRYLPSPLADAQTQQELLSHFTLVEHPQGHVLVRASQRHDFVYFILQGAVRSYYLKDGVEVNTWFAFEHDIVGSLLAYREQPSRETIELLEPAQFVALNLRTLRPLAQESLAVSNLFGAIVEEHALFLEDRLFFLQHMSAPQRYAHLLAHEPQVLRRVPLTAIASYLGLARETLSRLRGK